MGSVSAVERELAGLWRRDGDEAVVRACAHNLVVVCGDGAQDVADATEIVARVSETDPGRALVVARPEDASGLQMFVSAHCHLGRGGMQICSEQVTLEAGREALPLVPGSILQLLVEDMPVYTWWRRPELEDDPLLEPLRNLSDSLIVDGARFDRPSEHLGELRRIAAHADWKGHATDVVWERLEPWRDAVAAFFDAPSMRGCLGTIRHVTVAAGGPATDRGLTVAGAYIGGWLVSRLGWMAGDRRGRFRASNGRGVVVDFESVRDLPAGEISSVRIEAGSSGAPVSLAVGRLEAQSVFVVSTVETQDTRSVSRKIKLPERDEAALLCGTLQESTQDPLFEATLEAVSRMV